jgi:uncharacterized membrane protein YhhN
VKRKAIYITSIVVFFAAIYPAILVLKATHFDRIIGFLIPLFVLVMLFNSLVLYRDRPSKQRILLVFAFFFAFIGDTIINFTPYRTAIPLPFAVTHILLAVYFFKESGLKKRDAIFAVPILMASGLILFFNLPRISSGFVAVGLTVYLIILSAMAWRGSCCVLTKDIDIKKRALMMAGALLFYTTDVLVGMAYIYDTKDLTFWIWIVYPPALFCLSIFNWFDARQAVSRSKTDNK